MTKHKKFDASDFLNDALTPVEVDTRCSESANTPRQMTEDDFPQIKWDSDAIREMKETSALVDKDALLVEIAGLNATDAAQFDRFCENFQPATLPKGAAALYKIQTEIGQITWLYARWSAMGNHLRLAGYTTTNTLLDHDRLSRALQSALANLTTPLANLPGFALSPKQCVQVCRAFFGAAELVKLFPEAVAHFKSQELVNNVSL